MLGNGVLFLNILQFCIQIEKARAAIDERHRGFTLAKPYHKLAISQTSGNKRGEVTVRRDEADNIHILGIKHIHNIDDQSHIGRIFSLGQVELLHGLNGKLVQYFFP